MSAFADDKNPMRIPDLTPMYEAVRDFIKANQGKAEFICVDDDDCDTIWTFFYEEDSQSFVEYQVKVVRVADDEIEIAFDSPRISYRHGFVPDELDWYLLRWSDVLYIPTIFNLAENIQEYI